VQSVGLIVSGQQISQAAVPAIRPVGVRFGESHLHLSELDNLHIFRLLFDLSH
jgi:hypothetical protein